MLRFGGLNMLQRGDYAREICYFVVVRASHFPLQPVRAVSIVLFFCFFFCFFFGVAQAFKRRFCSGKCYFSVILHPTMLRFWGLNMLQRGDYATLWLFKLPISPCNMFGQYPFCFFFGVAQAFKR